MRTIKYNRQYDTNKAKMIATAGEVSLYQKRSREFFLADNVAITPLTYGLAKEWVAENLSPEMYRELFHINPEQGPRVKLNLTISIEAKQTLSRLSAKSDKSISRLIEEWVETIR